MATDIEDFISGVHKPGKIIRPYGGPEAREIT